MASQLAADDFNQLFRHFTRSAFRLETRDSYAVSFERDAYDRFLAGRPVPSPAELPWYRLWLDQIRSLTQNDKQVVRVRLLADPPTDYQRFELWGTPHNLAAGESIQFIAKHRAGELGLPLRDWWRFDDSRLAQMHFDEDGRPLGGTLVTDRP